MIKNKNKIKTKRMNNKENKDSNDDSKGNSVSVNDYSNFETIVNYHILSNSLSNTYHLNNKPNFNKDYEEFCLLGNNLSSNCKKVIANLKLDYNCDYFNNFSNNFDNNLTIKNLFLDKINILLISLVINLDKTIYIFNLHQKPTFYSNIKEIFDKTKKVYLSIDLINKINELTPSFYNVSFKINDKTKCNEYYISFPSIKNFIFSKEHLALRLKIFLYKINNNTNKQILNTVDDTSNSKGSNYKPNIGIYDRLVNDIDDNHIYKKIDSINKNETIINKNLKGDQLKESILALVKQKESLINEHKLEEKKAKFDFQKVKQLCEYIKLYYTSRNVTSMFSDKVVDYIHKNSKFICSRDEINKMVDVICEFAHFWITKIKYNDKFILKIKQNVKFSLVVNSLESAIN